jgi:hypothetical protein
VGVSADLIAMVRMSAFLPDAHPDYTDAQIRKEMTQTLHTVFGDVVVTTRGGYWSDESIVTSTAGKAMYRIPGRAIAGGLEKVEIADGSGGGWGPLIETTPFHAWELTGPSGSPTQGSPTHYICEGDQIQLIPAPSTANFRIKLRYYRRPGAIVEDQTRGLISAVNTSTRVLTVNSIPFDQLITVPAAITSGTTLIDVIHPDGWHEVALTGAAQTHNGTTTITVGGTLDMSKIEVGDYVRAAEQSDWPSIPKDFYRTLADATAVEILTSMGAGQKGAQIAQKMGADMGRFRKLMAQRVKDSPRLIKATQGFLFGRRRSFPVNYP